MAKKHKFKTVRTPRTQQELIQIIESQGGVVSMLKSNHYQAVAPNGKRVILAGSPSDHRSVANCWAYWKKALRNDS